MVVNPKNFPFFKKLPESIRNNVISNNYNLMWYRKTNIVAGLCILLITSKLIAFFADLDGISASIVFVTLYFVSHLIYVNTVFKRKCLIELKDKADTHINLADD